MTSVTITYEEKPDRQCYSLEAYGHAEYSDSEDIVCAAVSMLTFCLAGRLEHIADKFTSDLNDGDAFIGYTNEGPADLRVRYAFETIQAGFELLGERYPGHVSVDVMLQ